MPAISSAADGEAECLTYHICDGVCSHLPRKLPLMKRRNLVVGATASLLGCGARAQSEQPIRVVVGFQAGGSTDALGRVVAFALQEVLGRSVIVDNRPGAGGMLAMDVVRAAKPGDDVYVVTPQGSVTLFPYVYRNLRYDPVGDFTPVSRLISFDYALTVGPGTPARTLEEYVRWAAANPDKATFASAGAGTTPHFVGVAFHQKAGASATHVPYKGTAPALPDLLSGRMPATFAPLADTLQYHRAGKLRIIGTAGAERSVFLPDVRTFKEAGISVVVPGWQGLYGPKDMPARQLAELNAAMKKALGAKSVDAKLMDLGMTAAPSSSAELAAVQKQEFAFWGPVVKSSGFKPDE